MQCRRLSVWSVNFNFITLSCPNYFFPEGMGGVHVHETCGNFRGMGGGGGGGYFWVKKMGILGRGDLREIPSLVGVWIFSGTTHF